MSISVLSVDDLSRDLKIHRETVLNLLERGVLPGVRVGRQWRILESELVSFLRGGGKGLGNGDRLRHTVLDVHGLP
jgi:excisionase family DNA binding protein